MKKYVVSFSHKIIQGKSVEVLANSEEEAIDKAQSGEWASDEEVHNEDGLETFDYEAEEVEE